MQISVLGDAVSAKVNGKPSGRSDKNAEKVRGRGTAITYGDRKRSKKPRGVLLRQAKGSGPDALTRSPSLTRIGREDGEDMSTTTIERPRTPVPARDLEATGA